MGFLKTFSELGNSILDFVFPAHCILCSSSLASVDSGEKKGERNTSHLVCLECWKRLNILPHPFCPQCRSFLRRFSEESGKTDRCPKCSESALDKIRSLGLFDNYYQILIHNIKYRRKINLGKELAKRLGEILEEEGFFKEVDYLVPVPLHPSRKRERGYNQSEILAEELSRISSLPMLNKVLLRKRNTKDQTNLCPEERESNVKGAFLIRDAFAFEGKNVILVDDVMTTGATLRECSRILKSRGAGIVIGATLAVVNN